MSQEIQNFLLRKPGRPFNPYSSWKAYKDKEIVFDSEKNIQRWDTHPQGIIAEIDGSLFINGEDKVFSDKEGDRNFMWFSNSKGFLVRREDKFLINDKDLIYEGEWDDWRSHPEGVVIEKEGQLLLNGQGVLYEDDREEWDGHLEGVIVQVEDQILLNGETLLYKGEFDTWLAHPRGVIVQKGSMLILNTQKVIYEGEIEEWACHPEGIIMKQNKLWIFYSI